MKAIGPVAVAFVHLAFGRWTGEIRTRGLLAPKPELLDYRIRLELRVRPLICRKS
jgi:hypothetical protein